MILYLFSYQPQQRTPNFNNTQRNRAMAPHQTIPGYSSSGPVPMQTGSSYQGTTYVSPSMMHGGSTTIMNQPNMRPIHGTTGNQCSSTIPHTTLTQNIPVDSEMERQIFEQIMKEAEALGLQIPSEEELNQIPMHPDAFQIPIGHPSHPIQGTTGSQCSSQVPGIQTQIPIGSPDGFQSPPLSPGDISQTSDVTQGISEQIGNQDQFTVPRQPVAPTVQTSTIDYNPLTPESGYSTTSEQNVPSPKSDYLYQGSDLRSPRQQDVSTSTTVSPRSRSHLDSTSTQRSHLDSTSTQRSHLDSTSTQMSRSHLDSMSSQQSPGNSSAHLSPRQHHDSTSSLESARPSYIDETAISQFMLHQGANVAPSENAYQGNMGVQDGQPGMDQNMDEIMRVVLKQNPQLIDDQLFDDIEHLNRSYPQVQETSHKSMVQQLSEEILDNAKNIQISNQMNLNNATEQRMLLQSGPYGQAKPLSNMPGQGGIYPQQTMSVSSSPQQLPMQQNPSGNVQPTMGPMVQPFSMPDNMYGVQHGRVGPNHPQQRLEPIPSAISHQQITGPNQPSMNPALQQMPNQMKSNTEMAKMNTHNSFSPTHNASLSPTHDASVSPNAVQQELTNLRVGSISSQNTGNPIQDTTGNQCNSAVPSVPVGITQGPMQHSPRAQNPTVAALNPVSNGQVLQSSGSTNPQNVAPPLQSPIIVQIPGNAQGPTISGPAKQATQPSSKITGTNLSPIPPVVGQASSQFAGPTQGIIPTTDGQPPKLIIQSPNIQPAPIQIPPGTMQIPPGATVVRSPTSTTTQQTIIVQPVTTYMITTMPSQQPGNPIQGITGSQCSSTAPGLQMTSSTYRTIAPKMHTVQMIPGG